MNIDRLDQLIRAVRAIDVDGLIIAGGAVRDAYLGIEGRDIDFIVQDPGGDGTALAEIVRKVGEVSGQRTLKIVERKGNPYDHAFELYRSDDEKVELIVAEDTELEYVDSFHDDISQMWVDGSSFHANTVALKAAVLEEITVDAGRDKRFEKLEKKFGPLGFTVKYAQA
jgi:hypothetical protein